MHCIQDILQSNDNDDLLCNASPHLSINSNGSTPSTQSLQTEHHQNITLNFFDAVKKWLTGKDKEKKEFGDIMRKIQNQSSLSLCLFLSFVLLYLCYIHALHIYNNYFIIFSCITILYNSKTIVYLCCFLDLMKFQEERENYLVQETIFMNS